MNILFALIMIGCVGWMIFKRFKPQSVLVIAGLILMIAAYAGGYADSVLPAKQKATGFVLFDLFEFLKNTTSTNLAGLGLTIMAVTGFAKYMDQIGASSALVRVAMVPLSFIKSPYIIMCVGYVVMTGMAIIITSASGLAMLGMVTIFPILTRAGISRVAAASIVSTGHLLDTGVSAATSILIAKLCGISVTGYFIEWQIPMYVITCLATAVVHFFWQRYLDKRDAATGRAQWGEMRLDGDGESKEKALPSGPGYFALLPLLPLCLLIPFSGFFNAAWPKLHVVTAMFLSFAVAMVCQFLRSRDLKKTLNDIQVFLKGMGDQFTLTVSLIIAGATFAHGLTVIGSVDAAIDMFKSIGLNAYVITVIFVAIILFFSFVMGSGVATMYAFAPLVPPIATGIGVAPAAMLMHLQNASSIGRFMSPISAINIAVCGLSGISPFELIRRNIVPGLAAQAVSSLVIFIMYYAS